MQKGNIYSAKLYINGVAQSLSTKYGSHNSSRILNSEVSELLGDAYNNHENSSNSTMDDVVIWNRQLSDTEVANFYNATSASSTYKDNVLTATNLRRGTEKGENFMRLFGSSSSTELIQFIQTNGVAANTKYTISADIRVNSSYTTKPALYAKSLVNGSTLASKTTTKQGEWERLSITVSSESVAALDIFFSKGNATSIDIRRFKIEIGTVATPDFSYATPVNGNFDDFPELKNVYNISNTISYSESGYNTTTLNATNVSITPVSSSIRTYSNETVTLYKNYSSTITKNNISNSSSNFPSSIAINDNGYVGNIPLVNINWSENWITGRTVNLSDTYTDNSYYENINKFKYPSTINKSYTDPIAGQTINGILFKNSNPTVIDTKTETIYSESWGYNSRYDYRLQDLGLWLGYMSNNTSTYWGGAYSFNDSRPRKPKDYYGPREDKNNWELIDWQWLPDENYVGDANNYSGTLYFGYPYNSKMFISDAVTGHSKNRYRKGVYLKYKKDINMYKYQVSYSGTIKIPDYIKDYNGTAYYSGTLQKSSSEGTYKIATQWTVSVTYTGTLTAINNAPVADFTITPNPALDNEQLNIDDNSYDPDPWDRIVSTNWSYSSNGGSTYSTPTSTPPKNLPYISGNYTIYNIKLVVTDTMGATNTCIKQLTVYPNNTKPTASFYVNPNPVLVNQTLNIVDQSSAEDAWDSIDTHYWYYKKTTDTTWTNGKPTKFTSVGTYEIKHQVKDKGNVRSPALLSDEYIEKVYVSIDDGTGKPAIPNIQLQSITIVGNSDDVPRTTIYRNVQYRIKAVIKNTSLVDITTSFNTLFNIDSVGSSKISTSSLLAGETKTLYYTFTCTSTSTTELFEVLTDCDNFIIETNEEDNAKKLTLNISSNIANLKANSISITDINGNVVTQLIQNLQYKAKISITNNGQVALSNFEVGLYENNIATGTDIPISSLAVGETKSDIIIPFTATKTGLVTYTAKVDDNNEIDEVNEADNNVSLTLSVDDLQLVNYRITNIVNAPVAYTYPIGVASMPAEVKAGYKVTFQIDVIGSADTVISEVSDSNGNSLRAVSLTKVSEADETHSTWEYSYVVDINTPVNTILYTTLKSNKGSFIYNFNEKNNWNGETLKVTGNALEDIMIHRIY